MDPFCTILIAAKREQTSGIKAHKMSVPDPRGRRSAQRPLRARIIYQWYIKNKTSRRRANGTRLPEPLRRLMFDKSDPLDGRNLQRIR
jgi:hypothetical protein